MTVPRLTRWIVRHRVPVMTALAALVLLALVVLSPPDRSGWGWSAPAWPPLPTRPGYDGADIQPDHHLATALHERYRVDLLAAAGSVAWDGHVVEAPDPGRVDDLLAVLDDELGRYPDGLLAHSGLQSVALAGTIRANGDQANGVTFGGGHLLLDVGMRAPRRVVHHEMWHQLEREGALDFRDWSSLNPAGHEYVESDWERSPPGRPCFVSLYATSRDRDDRAEVFAAVMTGTSLDTCTRAKATRMARALAAFDPRLPAPLAAYLVDGS